MLQKAPFLPHLPSTDLARSKEFYVEKLGLRVRDEEEWHFRLDLNGASVLVYKRDEPSKAEHTAAAWIVDDVDATVKALKERGVKFERYDGFEQDELGISRVRPGPTIAWFTDPDRNIFSIFAESEESS